jgi:hypothetical protein
MKVRKRLVFGSIARIKHARPFIALEKAVTMIVIHPRRAAGAALKFGLRAV